jgi:hypothetical protein
MVSHLFYYQLALLALVWLFVMLPVAASRRGAPIPPTAMPIKPKSTRSNEPKPFHGLTHKQWPHGKKSDVNWRNELLQILQEVRSNCKTRNQLFH